MNYNENIGNIIASARKKKNMSQNNLAKRLFVTRQAVSNWELGKTNPDVSVIFKLCKILDIDIKTIIDLDKNIKVENIIEIEKKKTNRRNLIFIGLIVLVFVAIIITLFIVFNHNAFVVYNVYLDSDEFELNNSLIVKSKIKNYFQFGTLVSKLEDTGNDTIYNIRLYKKNDNNEEKLIFEQAYKDNIIISEDYGYGEYFDDFDVDLNNLYLKISYFKDNAEHTYDYKLRVEESFKSDSLIYLKDKAISNYSEPYQKNDDVNITNLTNNGYVYDNYYNSFVKQIDNRTIMYYPKINFLSFKETNNNSIVLIDYFITQDRFKVTICDLKGNEIEKQDLVDDFSQSAYADEIDLIKSELLLTGGK